MRLMFSLLACAALAAGCASHSRIRMAAEPDPQSGYMAEPSAIFLVGLAKGDATLTRAGLVAATESSWKDADADGDGVVRSLELQAWRRAWFGTEDGWPGLFHFDQSADGAIDRREFREGLAAIFDGADADKDSVITRAELLTERAPVLRHAEGPAGGAGRRGSGGHDGHPPSKEVSHP